MIGKRQQHHGMTVHHVEVDAAAVFEQEAAEAALHVLERAQETAAAAGREGEAAAGETEAGASVGAALVSDVEATVGVERVAELTKVRQMVVGRSGRGPLESLGAAAREAALQRRLRRGDAGRVDEILELGRAELQKQLEVVEAQVLGDHDVGVRARTGAIAKSAEQQQQGTDGERRRWQHGRGVH